jgi:hypothetical protein
MKAKVSLSSGGYPTTAMKWRAVMAEVYRPFYLNAAPLLYVGRRTAELMLACPLPGDLIRHMP